MTLLKFGFPDINKTLSIRRLKLVKLGENIKKEQARRWSPSRRNHSLTEFRD